MKSEAARFEDRVHGGDVPTGANQILCGSSAEQQADGFNEDGLSGAGFPGQHREARRELELQFVNDDEVADRQRNQHAGGVATNQPRECDSLGITLQCSFWRSVAKKL